MRPALNKHNLETGNLDSTAIPEAIVCIHSIQQFLPLDDRPSITMT